MVSEIGDRHWMGEQGAAAETARERHPREYSCKWCLLTGTVREYWTVGLGPIEANHFESGLMVIPSYCSISSTKWGLIFADGAGTPTKILSTDDGGFIPAIYEEFVEVFSTVKAERLPPQHSTDHPIDLEPGCKLHSGRVYKLSMCHSRTLKAYIEANLANGLIQPSSSLAAGPILYAKKKDGGLRLCVDYCVLNLPIVGSVFPHPLISEMLDYVCEAEIFTKPHVRSADNLIWVTEGNASKTAFRKRYGQFEYWDMPISLTNAPAIFQS